MFYNSLISKGGLICVKNSFKKGCFRYCEKGKGIYLCSR